MKKIKLSAPGKIIISGEHAVVYGYPGLVAAVNKRVYLTVTTKKDGFNFRFKTEIPNKSGFGSSGCYAALEAAALSWIIGKKSLNREQISQTALSIENIAHAPSSGIDTTIAVYGGVLFYQKEKGFKKLKFDNLPQFLLINTGKPQETTGKMVAEIVGRKVKEKNTRVINSLKEISRLPRRFIKALRQEDHRQLKNLIIENERLLEKIGIVGKKAIKIINDIEKLGGAAKICGGGGISKGSGIALVYHNNLSLIKKFCQKNKLEYFEAKLGEKGLSLEK